MALDLRPERFGSRELPRGAEATGGQILANIQASEPLRTAKSFINEANRFKELSYSETSGDSGFNAADFFEERKQQAENLKNRAAYISQYVDDHADSYTQESYDFIKQYLSTFDTEVDDVLSRYQPSLDSREGMRAYEDELLAAMERNEQLRELERSADFAFEPGSFAANMMPMVRQMMFGEGDRGIKDNWSDEQRYRLGLMQKDDPTTARKYAEAVNAGKDPYLMASQEEQRKANLRAMDLDAEKREIDRMKAELDAHYQQDFDFTSSIARKAYDQKSSRLEQEISDREQQYNLAKREQESAQFRAAADRNDFATRSGYVGTGEIPTYIEDADPNALVYEYINDPDIRSRVNQQTTDLAAKGYDLLNEEEVGIYNYYYATEGPVKAQQYLDNIQDTLNQRIGERGAASKDQLWKQLMAGAISGYSNAVTSPQYFFDKDSDYINTSPFQYMSGAIREDLAETGKHPMFDTSLGQMAYDLVNTTANMLPSIMLSKGATAIMPGVGAAIGAIPKLGAVGTAIGAEAPQIGAAVGSATMGLSAAGGAYQQALNAGYTKEQAKRYAALSGASEIGLEYLLGGISKLGGEIPQSVIREIVDGVDNAIARAAISLGGSMASEGFEEGLQEVITPWIENLTLYAGKDVNWNEVAYSTLLGALSSGVMEGPGVAVNTYRVSKIDKQLKDLGAKGNTLELAELIVKHRSGGYMSQEEFMKLVKSEPAMQILEGLRSAEPAEPAIANMTAEQVEEMKPTTTTDGNARLMSANRSVDVQEFAEVTDGKAKVKLADGGTADYQDISFGTEKQGNQFFAVESLPVIDTDHANELLNTIRAADVGKDTAEVVAIRESYRLGYMGATTQELRGSDASILPTKVQDQIYNIGKQQRTTNDAIRAQAKAVTTKPSGDYKKVIIEGKLSNLRGDAAKKRKAEIAYVDRIADTFAGTNVHVYESYKKNGKMYYKDNSGVERLAPNGRYVNDEIWVDLNSGDNGEGMMLNTFAHEMYHHIEKWNKPKARELAEFVVKELGLESVDKAVAAQIEKARAAGYGEEHFADMTPEQARNEVYMRAMSDFVADSLETMFTRGDPAKAIANLKKENKTLFDQIKAFIDEWISKVKKFYSDNTISQEGAMVAQLEKFEQLQQLFMEAMAGAGENYRAAEVVDEKSTTQESDAKYQARNPNSFTDAEIAAIQKIGRKSVNSFTQQDLKTVKKFAEKYWKEMGTKSPFFRAWFGDWRVSDQTPIRIAIKKDDARGVQHNSDTGWDINVSGQVFSETKNHRDSYNIAARPYLPYINDIVRNAVLLDSFGVDSNKLKSPNSLLMHSLYAVADIGKGHEVLKLYVEEMNDPNKDGTTKRSYQLQNIEKYHPTAKGSQNASPVSAVSGTIKNIADLFQYVNNLDSSFKPHSPSAVTNSDGTPRVMYHGTSNYGFRSFNTYGGKFGLFGKGSYFTDNPEVADSYTNKGKGDTTGVYDVYLNIKNPLDMDAKADISAWQKAFSHAELDSSYLKYIKTNEDAFRALKENLADDGYVRWEAEEIATDLIEGMGYDGITHIGGGRYGSKDGPKHKVYIAFNPEQIKSATENIGTFDRQDTDIYYSLRNQKATAREILTQIDTSTRNKHEANLLGQYQENLAKLAELEPRLEELNNQIAELSQDKKRVKELLAVQKEQRQVKASVNRLNRLVNAFERSDMGKRLVTEVRAKARQQQDHETLKAYKEEQKKLITSMQTEQRVIREELTGTRSVMSIMEDEFVRLAKDLEAKKIDLKTMEEKFLQISKQYDKDTQKWLREYRSLMSKYRKLDAKNDRNLSKIEQLEEIILRQRQTARAKVTSRRNTELRHKIQRKANELNQLMIHGTKHRNVPEYLQPAVADILNAINMEVRDGDQRRATYEATLARYDRRIAMTNDLSEVSRLIEKRNEYAAKGDQFANKMAKLKEAYQKIQDDKIPNMEIDEGLASRLMELFVVVGDTPLGQMTSEQLEAVNDVLNITKATVRNANEMLSEARSAGVVESSKSAIMEIKSAGETKKKKTRFRKGLEQFGWNNLKPVYVFDVIGSKTLTDRYKALRNGEDILAVDLNEAKNFFQEQWKKNGGKDWNMEQKWKFKSTSGKSFELDLNQIMSLYALAKDQDARSHLRVGGFAFDSDYQTKEDINLGPVKIPVKVESTDASAYNLSDEILGDIISKLTPQQRAFADAMQAYLSDTMAAKGNEVSLKKYGIRLFKKKDYFPIRVADQFMAKAREQQSGDRKLKDSGFTKDRKPEAKNPVVLSGFTEVWAEHVDEMSLYHSFVLPLDDFNRVLNYHDAFVEGEQAASVVEAITNAFGKGAVNYIDQLIKDVNGGIKGGSTVSFANSLVSKAKKAQTMASLSVAIQQPSSIIRAMSEVDSKYFIGPRVTEKSHDRTWNEIKKHAPIAIIKEMGGYDTNVGKSTVDYLIDTADYDGFGEKFKALFTDEKFRDDALGRLPAWMDEMSWGVIWNAVKREQRDLHPNMDTKSDAFMKLVANRFTEVITRTQVYDSVFSRSGMMRDRNDLAKVITSFMAEPTTTANMLAVSILQAKRGDISKTQLAKTAGSIVASLALNSALVSVIYALRDDDEDKRYDEKWIENFRNNFFESLNPLGYIPYVRDVYNLFVKGYDVERADLELFGDLQNAIDGLGNEDITAWEKTENVIGAIGNLLGVPVRNILRDVKGIVQTLGFAWDDRPNPKTKTGTYMAWRGMDLTDKEQMILAIRSGDEEHLQRVFGRFESQQKAESALQSAIREKYVAGEMTAEEAEEMLTTNFDRDDEYEVYWLLDQWDYANENGNTEGYTKYGTFFETIENGGDYTAEMDRLMAHGAEASEIRSQISRHYRKQYLADAAVREEIREKLQPVYEATGMYDDEIQEKFNDWDFEAEYGMTYSNFKAEYREGNVTEAEMRGAMDFYGLLNYEIEEGIRGLNEAIKFYNKYGMSISEMRDAYDNGDLSRNELINALVFTGKTKTEATEEVNERDLERKYGIEYAKLDDAYKYNDISRQEFYNAMVEHGAGKQEADEAILGYDWLKKNVKKYPDLAISDAKRFVIKVSDKMEERTLTDYGVSIDAYLKYKEGAKDCPGVDANGDGKIDAYSKAKQLFAMIDKLPISNEAKDGLALVTNAQSTLRKYAPWRKRK